MNLAARAGRWSAAHWKTATLAWIGLVVAAIVAGSAIGTRSLTTAEAAQGDTARAETMLARAGFRTPAGESILVRGQAAAPGDPTFRATVRDLLAALRPLPQVERIRSGALSKDGRSELVSFDVAGNPDSADTRIQPVLDAVAGVQRAHPSFTIAEVGMASANRAANQVIEQDLSRAERLSVPITFLILLIAFGAFVAAGIPVLLAFSAVLASLGLGAGVSHVIPASDSTASVVVLMGMAVGVDYSLFYLRREREERARGRGSREALHAAAATSGRAVLVSGLTVVIACAGMLLSGSSDFVSMGVGAILVVLISMIGSLTVLPALLGRLEDRVERGVVAVLAAGLLRLVRALRWNPAILGRLRDRRTLLQRARGESRESRAWGLVLRPALRFPRTAVLAASALMIVIALPAFGMRTANPGFDSFPSSLPVVKAYKQIEQAFPGTPSPAEVVVRAPDVDAPAVRQAMTELKRRALASGQMHAPIQVVRNRARTVARIDVPLAGSGADETSYAALGTLRSRLIPATVGSLPGVQVAVTGDTASSYDFSHTMSVRTPLVVAFVL
ncbi:MAG: MMPL family transporter, partial [Gaiellaceae bacterium]